MVASLSFKYTDPVPAFDRSKVSPLLSIICCCLYLGDDFFDSTFLHSSFFHFQVKGMVCDLIKVVNTSTCTALEVTAGIIAIASVYLLLPILDMSAIDQS